MSARHIGLACAVAVLAVSGAGCEGPSATDDNAGVEDASSRGVDIQEFDLSVGDTGQDVAPILDLNTAELGAGDAAQDAALQDAPPDVGVCSTPGCPCLSNGECDSGYCIESAAGQVCAQPCVTSCPGGLTCKTVTLSGGDTASYCVPSHPRICEPCKADADCSAAVGGSSSTCVPYVAGSGALLGGFCGGACDDANPCPDGYGCDTVASIGGVTSKQCVRSDLQCSCDGRAVKLGLSTTCSSANQSGKCLGSRACTVEGLGSCSAPLAVSETCNDIDDDCDGKTDEPGPEVCNDGTPCTYDNCVGGQCQHPAALGDCDDGSSCTTGDQCVLGKCIGAGLQCDDGWSYSVSVNVVGAIGCRPGGGAGHQTMNTGSMGTDATANCWWGSSNPWCTSGYGCNEHQGIAACCVDSPLCGNGVVNSPLETCDDGNKTNGDGCDNNCMQTTPPGC